MAKDEQEESKSKSEPMSAGQAIDWLVAHRGQELTRDDGDRVRMLPGDAARAERYDSNTSEWKPMQLSELLGRTFMVTERELPKLPEGAEWSDDGVLRVHFGGADYYLLSNRTDRDIYAALVEEFDTRPEGSE